MRERGIGVTEFIRHLAALPLYSQPGTQWEYSFSTDVAGRIVEVVSGQDLNAFVTQRITGPLGMTDTAFFLGERARDRVAEPQVDRATGRRPELGGRSPFEPASWFSGGGMVGTAGDYARFCQMMLNGGHPHETRITTRKTIELMTVNHLPPGTRFAGYVASAQRVLAPIPAMGQGFGLGFTVRMETGRNPAPGSVGDYSWAGASGPYFWVDPREELYAVLMMQAPNQRHEFRPALRQLVYQALV